MSNLQTWQQVTQQPLYAVWLDDGDGWDLVECFVDREEADAEASWWRNQESLEIKRVLVQPYAYKSA